VRVCVLESVGRERSAGSERPSDPMRRLGVDGCTAYCRELSTKAEVPSTLGFESCFLVRILTRYPCESGSGRSPFLGPIGPSYTRILDPRRRRIRIPLPSVGIGTGYSAGDEMPNAGCSLVASSGLIGRFRRFVRPFVI